MRGGTATVIAMAVETGTATGTGNAGIVAGIDVGTAERIVRKI